MTTTPDTRPVALLLRASAERGVRGTRGALTKVLRVDPHTMNVLEVDLPGARPDRSVAGRASDTPLLSRVQRAAGGWPEVTRRLDERTPRVVVAVDPVSAAAAALWRETGKLSAPLVGVTCGLRLGEAWTAAQLDRLSVADEIMARASHGHGVSAERLVPCGVPVCGGFSTPSPDEKREYRQRYGLAPDRPLVLLVTDGLEPWIDDIVTALAEVTDRADLLVDVEFDDETARRVKDRAARQDAPVRLFGKVDEAGELWAASTVVVARPHLYIEQRVLNMRLPLVCLAPQDRAEKEVADLYRSRGIGRRVDRPVDLARQLAHLLRPDQLTGAQHAMLGISSRAAAKKVARMVAQVGVEGTVGPPP